LIEKDFIMNFNTDGNPSRTALYLVDRGAQGKQYRWFDVDSNQWGMCGFDTEDALNNKDHTGVGFFPWVGPLTGPNLKHKGENVVEMTIPAVPKPKPVKVAKVAQPKPTKVAKAPKVSKAVHADGTVFFREDRQKWVAVWAGKQEAARPTAEACLAFLKKKYNVEGVVLK
jgi:hypothetical protein